MHRITIQNIASERLKNIKHQGMYYAHLEDGL